MTFNKTILSQQEKKWILEQHVTRISDKKEVLIYPMGAERYLSSVLLGNKKGRYNLKADIEGKDILVIPGYGNSGFIFAQAGAKSITVCDKDPVTIAWVKAFKKYYHYREDERYPSVGELLTALTRWYPPLKTLPVRKIRNVLFWGVQPKLLRRSYIFYLLSLVRQAIQSKIPGDFEWDKNIEFHAEELDQLIRNQKKQIFDTAFVPYLLGVRNGIEHERDIVRFIKQLTKVVPNGNILVSPSRNTKEFYILGQSYFVTTDYSNIQAIPALKPYIVGEDKKWFRTQGLAVFGVKKEVQKQ